MQGTFFRGTTHNQDARFSDKEKKLMKTMNFDEILDKKIDLRKVDLTTLEPWVDQQVTKILGIEDEVIPAMIINELEAYKKDDKSPNGKLILIRVTGFLERDAKKFMVDLWKLLLEGQESPHGIPISLIDQKKVELKEREIELKKTEEQLKLLEQAKQKLKEDQDKLKQINRLFTDRSSSVDRKQKSQADIKQSSRSSNTSNVDDQKRESQRKEHQERRHRELFKKYEEDEYFDKNKDGNNDSKKNEKVNRHSSSSSDSRDKKDHKKKDSHRDRKLRDDSSERKDRKGKETYEREDRSNNKSSKSKRDRSRS